MTQETVEERAKRLGLTQETVEQRAARLGLDRQAPTGHAGKPFVDAPEIALAKSTAKGHAGKPFVNATEVDETPDATDKLFGSVASLVREMPGGEAAQSVVRAVSRGQPYREARSDIRTAEDAAPALATGLARIAGGALSAAGIPGGPVLQGARYGALHGALNSNPDMAPGDRARSTAYGAAGGAAGGVLGHAIASQPVRSTIGAMMHPKLTLIRGAQKLGASFSEGAAGRAAPAVEAVADVAPKSLRAGEPSRLVPRGTSQPPRPMGLSRTPQDDLASAADAVKSEPPAYTGSWFRAGESPPSSVADVVRQRPDASSVVDAVKKGRQSHRTQASFDDIAVRTGKQPMQPPKRTVAPPTPEPPTGLAPTESDAAEAMLTKLRREQSSEPGNTIGDAEIAQGLPAPEQAIAAEVRPQPINLAAYLQARMKNPSLPRVPTPEILRSLGIVP